MDDNRVALLVDGENLPVEHAGFLILEAARHGTLCVKRVFGAVSRLGEWVNAPGFRVVHVPSAKNAADIALSLDALELALTTQVDQLVLATSDRDMALVALRLDELGVAVIGIGEEKAPDQFRKACRKFVKIPAKTQAAPQTPPPAAVKQPPFEVRLNKFLSEEGNDNGWVALNTLGQQRAKAAGVSKVAAGIGKSGSWLDWFKKHKDSYEIEERGTQSRARLARGKKA